MRAQQFTQGDQLAPLRAQFAKQKSNLQDIFGEEPGDAPFGFGQGAAEEAELSARQGLEPGQRGLTTDEARLPEPSEAQPSTQVAEGSADAERGLQPGASDVFKAEPDEFSPFRDSGADAEPVPGGGAPAQSTIKASVETPAKAAAEAGEGGGEEVAAGAGEVGAAAAEGGVTAGEGAAAAAGIAADEAAAAAAESVPGIGTIVGGLLGIGGLIAGAVEAGKAKKPKPPPPPPKPIQVQASVQDAAPVLDTSTFRATGYGQMA